MEGAFLGTDPEGSSVGLELLRLDRDRALGSQDVRVSRIERKDGVAILPSPSVLSFDPDSSHHSGFPRPCLYISDTHTPS